MADNKSSTHNKHSEKLLNDSSSDDDSPDPSLKTTEEEQCVLFQDPNRQQQWP